MVVGTSADYPPFSYFDESNQIDGFDIALMDAVAEKLGVEVEWHDIAFDGLGSAIFVGQIDSAIAAISETEERAQYVDFSHVYYVGLSGLLAQEDSDIQVSGVEDAALYRVGVQRGTVYDTWARTALVAAGFLPDDQLFF